MDLVYESTGGIEVFGCAEYQLVHFRYYKYAIGSILFSRAKALRGIYEKIAVKGVKFPDAYTNLYIDTFNGLWNEEELASYAVATALVDDYIILRNALVEDAVRSCKFVPKSQLPKQKCEK